MPSEPYENSYTELLTLTFFRIIKTVWTILKNRSYIFIAISVTLTMATIIPLLTLAISGIWIYNVTSSTLLPLSWTIASYVLSGVFIAVLTYSKRSHVYCRSGSYTGISGTVLSTIGCCSPVIYILFVVGLISSAIIPFLTLIPSISILLLSMAICLLANMVGKSVGLNDEEHKLENEEICCDILGRHLDAKKKWYTAKKASEEDWIPAFVKYVDAEKCIGCGLCIKVCIGECYEMRYLEPKEITVAVKGELKTMKVTRQAIVINQENCYGDCHCHKICPVEGGAMICQPKTLRIK